MVAETKVLPQNIDLTQNGSLVPAFAGMPWFDTGVKELKFVDTVDISGNPLTHVPALPQHTLTGEHGPKVTITQTNADNALIVNQIGNTTGINVICSPNASGIYLLKAGTGSGNMIDIANSGSGIGVNIIQSRTSTDSQRGLQILQFGQIHGAEISCYNPSATNSIGLAINQQSPSAGIRVNQSGASDAVDIIQNSTSAVAHGLSIVSSGGAPAIEISASSPTAGSGILINNSTQGHALLINQVSSSNGIGVNLSGNGMGLNIQQSGNGTGLNILQTGDGVGLNVSKTGNEKGLNISKTGTDNSDVVHFVNNSGSGDVLEVWQMGPGVGVNIKKMHTGVGDALLIDNLGIGAGLTVSQLGTGAAAVDPQIAGSGVVINRNASGNGHALIVLQQQTASVNSALIVYNYGANFALHVAQTRAANTAAAIKIDNIGSGYDIQGSANNWWVDKNGNSKFASVGLGTSVVGQMYYINWASAGGSNYDANVSFPLSSGTWVLRVDAVFHAADLFETILYINGTDVMHLPYLGGTEGTDYLKLMGVRTVTGGGSIPIKVRSMGFVAPNPVWFTVMAWKTAQ